MYTDDVGTLAPVGTHGVGVLHKAQYPRPWNNIPKSPLMITAEGG